MKNWSFKMKSIILKTKDKNIETKYIDFNPYGDLPIKYKEFYGIRFSGINNDGTNTLYGFDMYYQVTGCGLDLENLLMFCNTNNINIDWYNFQRTSYIRGGWNYEILKRKISHSIIDIFGVDYWNKLDGKLKLYNDIYSML